MVLVLVAHNTGWNRPTVLASLPIIAILELVAVDVFALGVLYYRLLQLKGDPGAIAVRDRFCAGVSAFSAVLRQSRR